MAQLVLRVTALLTVMAGTTLTFEILGDPSWMQDSFLVTYGDDRVSFLQMVYWIVVSITTVGYGDFTPKTVITRVLTTVFIVVGVASVYLIQFSFTEMRRQQHEGTGKYWQSNWGEQRHVCVILCHNGNASRMASLIHGFLQELLHASHNETEDHHDHASSVWAHIRLWFQGAPPAHMQTWPDVVFLSQTKWADDGHVNGNEASSFRKFLEATEDFPSRILRRIWFLVGSLTSEADLERARVRDSALTYILSDLKSTNPDENDAQTIYTAVVIRDLFPDVRLRLMLIKPESKELAIQAGIDHTRCFSSRELSAGLLAQNVRCRGLIPMVTAMLKSVDADDEEFFLRQALRNYSKTNAPMGRSSSRLLPTQSEPISSHLSEADIRNSCRSLEELEKSLRKSQLHWCPHKRAYERTDPWMFEYFEGAQRCIFGFDLAARYEGLSYGQLVSDIYHECGAIVMGVQQNGRLLVCPQSRKWTAKAGQVCLAVASSAAALDVCRLNPDDRTSWRLAFQASRWRRRKRSQQQGRFIAASRLMGKRLQQSLLQYLKDDSKTGPILDQILSQQPKAETKGHADLAIFPTSPLSKAIDASYSIHQQAQNTATTWSDMKRHENESQHGVESRSVRTLREGLRKWEDLVVLIVCNGEIWQQVRTFVGTLRQEYLPFLQPVVVLAPTAPPPGLLEDCGNRVVCLQGSSLRAQNLIEAGVLEAGTVVVLSGEVSHQSDAYDYRAVLTGQELECWLGTSSKTCFTAFELHDSGSAKHLPRLRTKLANQGDVLTSIANPHMLRRTVSGNTDESTPSPKLPRFQSENFDDVPEEPASPARKEYANWDETSTLYDEGLEEHDERYGSGIQHAGHRRRSLGEWLASFAGNRTEEKSHDSILYHPRFAAGEVFTPELWGMMLGRMFYMPAVIELMEALVLPSRREQNAYPWQVRIPDLYVGQPFSRILADLALGLPFADNEDQLESAAPRADNVPYERAELGQQDSGTADPGFTLPSAANRWPPGPPAVPIALYRLRADFSMGAAAMPGCSGIGIEQQHRVTAQRVTQWTEQSQGESLGAHNYVMLAPQPDTHIRDGDWLVVLGGKSFGKSMHERGLLRGCQPRCDV